MRAGWRARHRVLLTLAMGVAVALAGIWWLDVLLRDMGLK